MKKKINFHYIILGVVALIAVYAIIRLVIWNIGTKDTTEITSEDSEYDIESMDYIVPLDPQLLEGREDDGITTVVCIGNAPFADDRNDKNNLTKLMQKELGDDSKVYNCSVADSYMTSLLPTFRTDYPYDAFSFYWLSKQYIIESYTSTAFLYFSILICNLCFLYLLQQNI